MSHEFLTQAAIFDLGLLAECAKPNPNMVVRNLKTVRQRYHGPNAATIQKHELADFEAHCPCLNPDVSIITK
jgi:hypothetical protein